MIMFTGKKLQLSFLPIILPFFIFIFMVVKIEKRYRSKQKTLNLPPGPRKLPLVGNMHHFFVSLPHHRLRDLANKYGPLMHLQLGQISTLVVSSPEAAKQVMKTHDLIFAQRPFVLAANIITYGSTDIVFSPYGNYWKQLRKIFALELLSARRVQSFRSVREEEHLVESATINRSSDLALELGGGFSVADVFPSFKLLLSISGMRSKIEKIHRRIDRILENIINERNLEKGETNKEGVVVDGDLIDVLLNLQKNGELETPLTNDNIKAIIVDIFFGGSDTSSMVVEWAMSEMLKNPRVMEKAQAEVRNVFDMKGNVDESGLHELNYLKSVIKETLRLHPPAPLMLPRECQHRCEISGYEIPEKTKVLVNAWAIGRDSKYWSQAERFYPERFLDSSIDYKGANFELIPFGAGRRICPGILFGIANVELALAQLLYYFDWQLPNGAKKEELDMTEAFGLGVRRKKDLYLIPHLYHSHSLPVEKHQMTMDRNH